MNLIFLGPPGSGKGTQAKLIANKLKLNHISSGELLRNTTKKNDRKSKAIKAIMNRGEFVPFDTILNLIIDKIKDSPNGFILDGTPRDLAQAEHMDWFFKKNKIDIGAIIFFKLSDQESTSRLLNRAKIENRADDSKETIEERIKIYHQQTQSVFSHYQAQDKLITIDASPSIEIIHKDLLENLKQKSLV